MASRDAPKNQLRRLEFNPRIFFVDLVESGPDGFLISLPEDRHLVWKQALDVPMRRNVRDQNPDSARAAFQECSAHSFGTGSGDEYV